jgi:hypothetical protein
MEASGVSVFILLKVVRLYSEKTNENTSATITFQAKARKWKYTMVVLFYPLKKPRIGLQGFS